MVFIKYVCRVPLRMSDEMLEIGDFAIHGEEPYTFEYYNRNYRKVGFGHEAKMARGGAGDEEQSSGDGNGHGHGHEGVLMVQDPHAGGQGDVKDAIQKQD